MYTKTLFKLGSVLLVLTVLLSLGAVAQVPTRFLNSTDGDDSYDGTSATHGSGLVGPKKTIEGAYLAFGDNTVVDMAAGEYFYNQSGIGGGNDADGVTLSGGLTPKNMTFVISTYNANTIARIDGSGGFTIDPGTGKTITFAAASGVQSLMLDLGTQAAAAGSTGINAITFLSGTLNITGFTLTASTLVTAVTRTDGFFTGNAISYVAATRTFLYNGSLAAGSQTAGGELATTLGGSTITVNRVATTTVTFGQNLTATTGGVIQNSGAGAATFSGTLAITNAAGPTSRIVNNSTGRMTFSASSIVTFSGNAASLDPGGSPVVENVSSGTMEFLGTGANALLFVKSSSGASVTATVRNTNNGVLTITKVSHTPNVTGGVTTFIIASIINDATGGAAPRGIANIGGPAASEIRGNLTNDFGGTVNIGGAFTLSGILSNNNPASTITLASNTLTLQTSAGPHVNAGSITSAGVSSGAVSFDNSTAAVTWNGAGSLPNIQTTGANSVAVGITAAPQINGNVVVGGSGTLTLTAATTITGGVTVSSSGSATLTAATGITGNVNINGSGAVNMNAAASATIQGSVSITTGALNTIVSPNALLINGSVSLNNATSTLNNRGNTTVVGTFTETNGVVVFTGGNWILDLKSSFNRTAGSFTATTGTLQFSSGGQGQVFAGGTNFRVFNFSVTGVGTGVTFTTGSVEVVNLATLAANTTVILGTLNIRMVADGGVFTNGGGYTATGGGGVIFEGPGAIVTPVQIIGGTGLYSNIEIRLGDETKAVGVAAGTVVSFASGCQFTRGGIDIPAGSQFNPKLPLTTPITTPTVKRNLNDGNGASGADGKPFSNVPANFNVNSVSYDLEYFGPLTAATPTPAPGNEYMNNLVRNLTVGSASGATQYVDFNASARVFTGNLNVSDGAALGLDGFSLTGSAAGAAHVIGGWVRDITGIEQLVITGSGSITGGGGAAQVDNLNINPTVPTNAINISNLKLIGSATFPANGLSVAQGVVSLGLVPQSTVPFIPGNVNNYTQTGGQVTLGSSIQIPAASATGFAITSGSFDFDNNNLWWSAGGGNTFFAAAGTSFAATAGANGFLQFRSSGNLNTNGVLVPRIIIDPAAAGAFTVTLTGNSGVSETFTNNNDVLALATFTFEMGGTVWNSTGTYTGSTGTIKVTGNVTFNMSGNITVPNLTLANTTNTFLLVDADGSPSTIPSLTVTTLFTMTSGKINLQASDLFLTGGGSILAFVYDGGAFTQGVTGRLVFNGALTYNVNTATAPDTLLIPNLTVSAASTLGAAPSNKVHTVQNNFVFGAGSLTTGANDLLQFGDGCKVTRLGTGTLSHNPKPLGVIDLFYTTVSNTVDKEMPSSATPLRDLTVNPGGGNTITASKAITVNRTLFLVSGTYNATAGAFAVAMAANSTVNRSNGVLTNVNVSGGPIALTYSNSVPILTANNEYPTTITVTTLNVNGSNTLTLHATRSCGDFVMNMTAGTMFDLSGLTLSVTNATSAILTRGVLISQAVDLAGVYVFGNLNATGSLTSTAATTVTNVNINVGTNATLSGLFQTLDLDGGGPNVLPGIPAVATVTGNATFAGFTGNAVVGGNATVNGAYIGNLTVTGSATLNGTFFGNAIVGGATTLNGVFGDPAAITTNTLTTGGSVTVGPNGAFAVNGIATSTILVFNGTTNQTFTLNGVLNNGGVTLNTISMQKTGQTPSGVVRIVSPVPPPLQTTVTLAVSALAQGGQIILNDGLVYTGTNTAILISNSTIGNVVQGFTRLVPPGKQSHVFGNVTKTVIAGTPLTNPVGRFEYPVGDSLTRYRPAAITFTPANPTVTTTNITVRHVPVPPGGTVGFPITFAGTPPIVVDSAAEFSWLVTASIGMGPSQVYDLEFQGEGFSNYGAVENVRAIRRLDGSVANPWNPQGGLYLNFETGTPPNLTPIVRLIGSTGGMVPQSSHITFGRKKPGVTGFTVSGQPLYRNTALTPITGVAVSLTGQTNQTGGPYTFPNISGSVTLSGSKTGNTGGITATDALLAARYFVFGPVVAPLDTLQKLAADVNNNNIINVQDAQLIIGNVVNGTGFARGDWVFLGVTFAVTANVTQNLSGLCVGDVNGTFTPTAAAKVAAGGSVGLNTTGTQKAPSSGTFEVPLRVGSAMSLGAVTLKLSYPVGLVTFEGISSSTFAGYISNHNAEEGKISIAWFDATGGSQPAQLRAEDVLATLRFKAKDVKGAFSITLDAGSEFADAQGAVIENANVVAPLTKIAEIPTVFALEQNYPNPFNPVTNIAYSLPLDSKVTLTVYNIVGQQVASLVNGVQEAGVYTTEWNAGSLASGVYVYRLGVEAGSQSFTMTKRLVLLK